MRFFHVSDLHLGKTLHGYELLDDQAFVLEVLVGRIGEAKPDALLIAGDVYDRAVPPVEAIELFDAFLRSARAAAPGLQVVVVPGNHDSAGRLAFGASLMADAGLRIAARAGAEPALVAGGGAGKKVVVWARPFLTPASAPGGELAAGGGAAGGATIRSQQELMRLAIDMIHAGMEKGAAHVLVAHCFAAGGLAGDSELAFVGATEQVDTALFDGFDYVALGHLHSMQSPAPHVWYSGTPLAYSVKEGEKEQGFLSVEVLRASLRASNSSPSSPGAGCASSRAVSRISLPIPFRKRAG